MILENQEQRKAIESRVREMMIFVESKNAQSSEDIPMKVHRKFLPVCFSHYNNRKSCLGLVPYWIECDWPVFSKPEYGRVTTGIHLHSCAIPWNHSFFESKSQVGLSWVAFLSKILGRILELICEISGN